MSRRARYLLLVGLRWGRVGLLIPVLVLFALDRGFSLAQFGVAAAMQSIVVVILELPTGGLADVVGPRRVLTFANLVDLLSLILLAIVGSMPVLILVWVLQGIYRSLESGPLEAWYVSATVADDPEADIERDLSAAGTITGLAIAGGSLASSGLVALAPSVGVEPLLAPVLVAIVAQVVNTVAVLALVADDPHPALLVDAADSAPAPAAEAAAADPDPIESMPTARLAGAANGIRRTLIDTRSVVAQTARLVAGSAALSALLGVELLWGFGLVGFETLFPPRLAEVVTGPETAARLLGPVGTAAFLLMALGSSLVPRLSQRLGPAMVAALLRVVQGLAVLAMALVGGAALVIGAYLATMAVHGASNVVHSGLLHSNTDSSRRTTVISANSLAANIGGGVGSVALGVVAAGAGVPVAMVLAAVVLAAAAPLYFVVAAGARPGPAV